MQAARDNIKDPPGIFVKVGLESLRGTLRFIDDDLPRAFGALDDLHLLGDLADASTEAATAIGLHRVSRTDLAPRAKGRSGSGAKFEQKLRLDEGIDDRTPSGCSTSRCASCRHDAGGVPARRRRG